MNLSALDLRTGAVDDGVEAIEAAAATRFYLSLYSRMP